MNQDLKAHRDRILDLIELDRHAEALTAIEDLPMDFRESARLILAKGDCLYELGKDLEALECYLLYLKIFPEGRGRNFARFDAAMCLKNLDLHQEAFGFLAAIDDGHEGKEKELGHSQHILERQKQARQAMASLLSIHTAASDGSVDP
jgi:tetratricopeptide (TPR) repeat protein